MQRLTALTAAIGASLCLAAPLGAQVLYDRFDDTKQAVTVTGPYARYQTHVLQLSGNVYAVLFRPGFADSATALRAIDPICSAKGRRATGTGEIAPVDLVLEKGQHSVLQGYRVACK